MSDQNKQQKTSQPPKELIVEKPGSDGLEVVHESLKPLRMPVARRDEMLPEMPPKVRAEKPPKMPVTKPKPPKDGK